MVGIGKPDPRIFEVTCAQLGLSPADCVYVGDRLETDALAAQAAGLRGIWLDRGLYVPAEVDSAGISVIHDLRELKALLSG
jgi:putative hydrolase of the HAD superfamily